MSFSLSAAGAIRLGVGADLQLDESAAAGLYALPVGTPRRT